MPPIINTSLASAFYFSSLWPLRAPCQPRTWTLGLRGPLPCSASSEFLTASVLPFPGHSIATKDRVTMEWPENGNTEAVRNALLAVQGNGPRKPRPSVSGADRARTRARRLEKEKAEARISQRPQHWSSFRKIHLSSLASFGCSCNSLFVTDDFRSTGRITQEQHGKAA